MHSSKAANLHCVNDGGITFELVSGLLGNFVEKVVERNAKYQNLKNLKGQQMIPFFRENEAYRIHIARIAIVRQSSRLQKGRLGGGSSNIRVHGVEDI